MDLASHLRANLARLIFAGQGYSSSAQVTDRSCPASSDKEPVIVVQVREDRPARRRVGAGQRGRVKPIECAPSTGTLGEYLVTWENNALGQVRGASGVGTESQRLFFIIVDRPR